MNRTELAGCSFRKGSARSYRIVWLTALFLALFQLLFAAGFIARTTFVVEGQRYHCLFDDAMISMRYAANWASGHGFVWNPGERVEGYTNFAWTMLMGLCHLPGLSPSATCLLVQILGIAVLWSCLASTVVLAKSCRLTRLSACCAVVLAGTIYHLMFFTLFGMETGLLTCLVTFGLAGAIRSIREKQGSLAILWFVPAVLVRLDVIPIMMLVFLFVLVSVEKRRSLVLIGVLGVTATVLIHFLWRHQYYGEWLPNTYYLKATGWPLFRRLVAGIRQTFYTALSFGLPFLLALAALLRPKRWHFLIIGGFVLAVGYQVYMGGDAWPLSRFVLPMSIGLFVLTMEGVRSFTQIFPNSNHSVLTHVLTVVLCIIAINWMHLEHYLFIRCPQTTQGNIVNIKYVHAVEKIVGPDASVAVGMAGVFPYFSERRCFDILGKCDSHIARLEANPQINRAGHNKLDLAYTINTYKPDVILNAVDNLPEFYENYQPINITIDGMDVLFVVRKDNPKVRKGAEREWEELDAYLRRNR